MWSNLKLAKLQPTIALPPPSSGWLTAARVYLPHDSRLLGLSRLPAPRCPRAQLAPHFRAPSLPPPPPYPRNDGEPAGIFALLGTLPRETAPAALLWRASLQPAVIGAVDAGAPVLAHRLPGSRRVWVSIMLFIIEAARATSPAARREDNRVTF